MSAFGILGHLGEGWTAADQAELDVLVHELARGYFDEHRDRCEACRPGVCPEHTAWLEHLAECLACQGDAPLTFGLPCERRRQMVEHGNGCPRCNPCPGLRKAIQAVLEWREARALRSEAEWLLAEQERMAAGSRVHIVFDDLGEVVEYELLPPPEGPVT